MNSEHHIGEGETWDEQLRGIASAIVDHFRGAQKKAIDYKKIARETLSSQPPRAIDVPAQIDFCKKWGGGNSQQFVFDICEFAKMISGTCIVSSATFEAICRLKMPSDSMCPHFVAALVKCAASRGQARNGVSIHLSESDVKGLLKVLPEVQEANTYMEKARAIQKELGPSKSMVVARGTMECDMVDYVLNKMSKADKEKTSLGDISRNLLAKITATGDAFPTVVVEQTSQSTSVFDPTSDVVQQTLANHGWKIGTLVALKKIDPKTPKADEQFEIGHVNDDGTVGMHPLRSDGTVDKTRVVMTDQVKLQGTYKLIDESARLSRWDALSTKPPSIDQDFWLSVATQAMVVASYQHRNCPAGSVYIQKKPVVKVIVASVPARNFVITPYPAVAKKGKETSHIHLTVEADPPVDFNIEKPDMESLQVFEFWRMRRSPEKDHANMEISMVAVVLTLPKLAKGIPKSVTVQVPTAVPFTQVAPGDELVLYVPAKQKAEKTDSLLPAMQEPVLKKPMTIE